MLRCASWSIILLSAALLGNCGTTPMESDDGHDLGTGGVPHATVNNGGAGNGGTTWSTEMGGSGGAGWGEATGGVSGPVSCVGAPVSFQTSTVSFSAESFWIVANGQCFTSARALVQVHSDPGWSSYTTLELIWTELAREMRLFIYFKADASGWWSGEMRTEDGRPSSESNWLFYYGTFFQTPIGQAFHGDVDLTNDPADKLRGELHIHGLTLTTTLTGTGR